MAMMGIIYPESYRSKSRSKSKSRRSFSSGDYFTGLVAVATRVYKYMRIYLWTILRIMVFE